MTEFIEKSCKDIREVAISHHHDVATLFEEAYASMAKNYFLNAFSYGRQKIDVLLELELKRLQPKSRVLDVGCGTGAYLNRFSDLGFTPIGIEPAPRMLALARQNNPGVEIIEGIATSLPFPDASFDFVNAIEVFRYLHLADTKQAFRECLRVLKPGGIFFITMVNRWALDGFYLLQRMRQLLLQSSYNRMHPHCEFFTPSEVKLELEQAGFVRVKTLGRLFAPMRLLYKASPLLAKKVARRVERLDDSMHHLSFITPFSGHLIAIAERS